MTPTYNRPDLARFVALQMQNQSVKPDILCIHQNGTSESYEWSVEDVSADFHIKWIHTPDRIEQEQWYGIPLGHLVESGCDYFFWSDHDDIYSRDYIERGLSSLVLGFYDCSVNTRSGVLFLKASQYAYNPDFRFTAHCPGGVSSSLCFNRAFAEQLLIDFDDNLKSSDRNPYADQVVGRVTMKKFRCLLNAETPTTVYVAHARAFTSSHWVKE